MRLAFLAVLLVPGLVKPALARDCSSIVASVCDEGAEAPTKDEPRKVTVDTAPPALAAGDRFPIEGRSLLMNPTRYKLPPVDGAWRYYAMEGTVYRVDNATAIILEVIRDSRTWQLR